MRELTIGIGFDQCEAVAYHTLCHSILSRSSIPVKIIPIKRTMLREVHTREMDATQSNEFTYTRYLLPYLCGYRGVSLFLDSDMLVRVDIAEILDYLDHRSVHVVKHDYVPKHETKFLGKVQMPYPRKNWSSVMLFDNAQCQQLTPEYVNTASAKALHRFEWMDDRDIGELPKEWNHLVDEYMPNPEAKIVHWTCFGPWLEDHRHVEFSEEWFIERRQMLNAEQGTRHVPLTRVSEK